MLSNLGASSSPLTALDYGCLIVIALSIVLGALRGLIHTFMSLTGWVIALVSAYYSALTLSDYLATTVVNETGRRVLVFIATLAVALIIWRIAALILKYMSSRLGLNSLDHLLGGVFGFVRGGILLIAFTSLAALTPLSQTQTWQNSTCIQMAKTLAHFIQPFLPAHIAALLP